MLQRSQRSRKRSAGRIWASKVRADTTWDDLRNQRLCESNFEIREPLFIFFGTPGKCMYVVYICNIYRLGFAMKQQGNQRKTWCDVFWHLWSQPHHHPGDFGFFLQLQGSKGLNLRLLVLQCMEVKIGLPKKCCNSRRTIDCKQLDGAASKYRSCSGGCRCRLLAL